MVVQLLHDAHQASVPEDPVGQGHYPVGLTSRQIARVRCPLRFEVFPDTGPKIFLAALTETLMDRLGNGAQGLGPAPRSFLSLLLPQMRRVFRCESKLSRAFLRERWKRLTGLPSDRAP